MSFYSNLANTATQLIRDKGRDLTLGVGASARVVRGVRTETVKHTRGDSGVQIGDVVYLLEPSANPGLRERIIGDENLVIVFVDPIKPADTVMAWYVYGRNG